MLLEIVLFESHQPFSTRFGLRSSSNKSLLCKNRNEFNFYVNFKKLARSTQEFNGAQLKAVCVEAGMEALRRGGTVLRHEDFVEGISQVQSKKKQSLDYYA